MRSQLPYPEEDALKRILRKHDITITPRLVDHLAQLVDWVRQSERAKASFASGQEPMPLISLLGNMGIYGHDYLDKV